MSKKNGHFRNRIVGEGEEAPDQLLANPANWRIHPHTQEQALEGVLSDVGWVQRVIVNRTTGHVVDGHLRVALAIRRNEPSVPVVYVDLTEDEEKLVLASLDPLSALASADRDKLDALLKEVNSDSAAVQQMLSELAAQHGLHQTPPPDPGPQVDRAAELQQKWQVERGDLWVIPSKTARVEHRLLCGDCMVDNIAPEAVLVTDPPYGIEIDTSWLSALHIQRGKPANLSDDKLAGDDGSLDLSFLWLYDRRLVWGFPYIYDPDATGWIVWDKQPDLQADGTRDFVTPVEMASTTMCKGFRLIRVMWGGYYRAAGEARQPHPTQKPVQVIAPFIEQWTTTTDLIYDPFGGSGTTMVACEQLGRQCRMIEIEPKYCAVILERMQGMGLEPSQN